MNCRVCGEAEHATFPDCGTCDGRGHVIGGDDLRPCPGCSLKARRLNLIESPVVLRARAARLPIKDLTERSAS